jgi:hypothetical protein
MLLQSPRAHCKAPGGPGSIWKYLEALVRATGVSGRFVCGFQTEIHFADVGFSAKDLPGRRSQILNVRGIKSIDHHHAESVEDSSPDSISDTKNWLNWNGDLDNPNNSDDVWEADNESDTDLDNGSEDSETLEVRNVSAEPNVPGLIRPIRRSKKNVEQALLMVNIMETRRNNRIKKN